MSSPFDSPKLLISHGRDEIEDANQRIAAFFNPKPYTRIIETDRETGQEVHKIRLTAKLPGKVSVVVKDAAGSLRDALDHAVYASAVSIHGGTPKRTGFPFAKDSAGVKGELGSKRLSDNPPEIRSLLAGFDPHEGGNALLWGLNQIRNPNTHRIIVPVGAASVGNTLTATQGMLMGGSQLGYSHWDAAKNEVEYMRLGRGSNLQYKVNVAFDVLFEGIHPLKGKPVIATLREIADEVERVVLAIEAETTRISGSTAP